MMSQKIDPKFNPFAVKMNAHSKVKKVVAVVSGKGGVGKSMMSGLLATTTQQKGFFTGLLDADITGPSIGKMFGISQRAYGTEDGGIYPAVTPNELKIITSNMLLEGDDKAVMWRGIMINNAVKDFYSKVLWGELDVLYVDMPPGTGDVPLTVYQSLPIDGIVIVTTPQDLVSMIVSKAIDMANQMNIPILGVIENMSYMNCPCCDEVIYPFGSSRLQEYASKYNLRILGQLPIDSALTQAADKGKFDSFEFEKISPIVDTILSELDLYGGDDEFI